MRAYSWIALGCVALACGGSAFNTGGADPGGEGGAGDDDGGGNAGQGTGGKVGSGGKVSSGGKVGSGGTLSSGGNVIGGFGVAGDLVAGGTFPTAGEPGTAGSAPGPIDETCPQELPDETRGCAVGLTCSYGDDVRSSCRIRAKCEAGTWAIHQVECPDLPVCPAIIQGDACDANVLPGCLIDGYIHCVCTGCGAGGPCSTDTVWKCSAGSGGQTCPKLIPNEGQACMGNIGCLYGSCITDGPVTASCNGATWGWATQQCPQ